MIGHGYPVDRRRHLELHNAADVKVEQRLRWAGAIGRQDCQDLAIAVAV